MQVQKPTSSPNKVLAPAFRAWWKKTRSPQKHKVALRTKGAACRRSHHFASVTLFCALRVGNLQGVVNYFERLLQLLLRDVEGRVRHDAQVAGKSEQAFLPHVPQELGLDRVAAHGGKHALLCPAVLHQLQDAEQADAAHVAHRGVARLHFKVQLAHHFAHARRVAHNVLLLQHLKIGHCRGKAHGVRLVSQAAREGALVKRGCHLGADRDGAQGQVRGREALCHRDQIGHNVPVIHGKPLACAAQATHDFVAHEKDAVLVAQGAQALEVSFRGRDDAVGSRHSLNHYCRDGCGVFSQHDLLGLFQDAARELLLAIALTIEVAAVHEGVKEAHDAAHPRLVGESAVVACEHHGSMGRAVVRAVA
mmetsp:Transcript_40737/g.102554  ORF Transcript_40737/g.102554 Transcript_40737/m.102554 type:complete len:364 (+) Transcript_40737:190-1281(+)